MTVDIATLGIAVDTTAVKSATTDLNALADAGDNTARWVQVSNGQMGQFNTTLASTSKSSSLAAESAKLLQSQQDALGGSTANLSIGQQVFMDKLRDQAAAAGLSKTQLLELQAAQMGLADVSKDLIAQIEAATAAQGAHGISMSSSTAKMEAMRVVHDAMIGSYGRMTSSLFTLGNATGATTELLNPMTIGFVAVAAAVVGMVAAYVAGNNEVIAMNNAMAVTSNYAGQTRDSMNQLAEDVARNGQVTIGMSKNVVTALVASGQIGGQSLGVLAGLADNFAKATGTAIGDVAPKLVQLFADPLKGAEELNSTMHFLTQTDLDHIKTLDDMGLKQEAQLELAQKLSAFLPDQAKQVTVLGSAYNMLADAMSRAWDNAKKNLSGNISPYEQGVKDLQENIDTQRTSGVDTSGAEKALADYVALQKESAAASNAAATAAKIAADVQTAALGEINKGQLAHIQLLQTEIATVASAPDSVAKSQRVLELQKQIDDTYRAIGAVARAATQEQITQQGALSEITLKGLADQAAADLALGEITKVEYDKEVTQNQLQVNAAKQLSELRLAGVAGLTAAEKQAHLDQLDRLKAEADVIAQNGKNAIAVDDSKQQDDMLNAIYTAGDAAVKSLNDQIAKETQHGLEIGKTKAQVDALHQAQDEAATVDLQNQAAALEAQISLNALGPKSLAIEQAKLLDINAQIVARTKLAAILGANSDEEKALALQKAAEEASNKAANDAIANWQRAGASIADGLSSAFGTAGKAAGQMFKAYADGQAAQLRAQKELNEAKAKLDTDPGKIAAVDAAHLSGLQAQITSYGDMAAAAQGFFAQGTAGYQAMTAATDVLRIAEVALSLVKGVNAVLTQGEGDPYSAFGRMAAMAAIVVGLGVALSGGTGSDGGTSAADMQKTQGTGTVFGDDTAKSDSIDNSIKAMEADSNKMVPLNQSMLSALQGIEASMVGLTNLIVQVPGLTDGTNMNIATGQLNKGAPTDAISSVLSQVTNGLLGNIVGGKIAEVLNNLWGKTTQSIVDSGIQFGGSVTGLENGQGYDQYASVDTTKSSWFGLSKSTSNSVQTQGLSSELSDQFGLIFTNLETSLKAAAVNLGEDASHVTDVLSTLSLSTTSVSLKGLSGTALTDALNAVISKAMDQISTAVFPGLEQFAQVGEGYSQTVLRLASDYADVDSVLSSIGKTFGAVGLDSIGARENLIALSGGLDNFSKQAADYSQNYLTAAQQLAPVQKYVTDQMAALGLAGVTTRQQFADVVTGLDVTTDAGAKQYAAMMNLEAAFAQVYPAIQATGTAAMTTADILSQQTDLQNQLDQLTMSATQLAAKQRDAIADSNLALYDQVQAAQALADAATAAANALVPLQNTVDSARSTLTTAYNAEATALTNTSASMKAFAATISAFRDSLNVGSLSPLSPADQYAAAKASYESTLTAAEGGDTTAQGQLQSSATAFLNASKAYNASTSAYVTDFNEVQRGLTAMANSANQQADTADQQLKALNLQLAGLITLNASTVSGTNSITTAITTLQSALTAAIGGLQSALAAQTAAGGTDSGAPGGTTPAGTTSGSAAATADRTTVDGLYQQYLGRAPDKAGEDFWTNALMSGTSLASVVQGFLTSPEYLSTHSHAKGGIASGPSLVGENGPEMVDFKEPAQVYTASQTAGMFAGGGGSNSKEADAQLVEQTKQLRQLVIVQQAANLELIKQMTEMKTQLAGLTKRAKLDAHKK